MNSVFFEYHPITSFSYFLTVLLFTMFITDPIILAISFITAFLYALYLGGIKTLIFSAKFILPTILLIIIVNPLFNHAGATIFTYFPDGNPLTLESVIYGFVSGFLMSSVMLWFLCINKIVSSDKVIYIFGKISPVLGLLISMIMRFIPKFKTQFQLVRFAQRCIGKDISNGKTPLIRIKNAVRIFSIMILWSMENSIQTADSMKSRGYGLPHRTTFSSYVFYKRDAAFLIFLLSGFLYICFGAFTGHIEFYYFPSISNITFDMYKFSIYVFCFAISIMPLFLDIKEDIKWKYIQSRI